MRGAAAAGSIAALILSARLIGCFSLGEEPTGTRTVKVAFRLASLAVCVGVAMTAAMLPAGRPRTQLRVRAPGPVLAYGAVLTLAIASILYSSSPGDSALQAAMYLESLCFAVAFDRMLAVLRIRDALASILAASVAGIVLWMLWGAWVEPERFLRRTHGGEVARLGGFLMNPNEVGLLMAVGLGQILVTASSLRSAAGVGAAAGAGVLMLTGLALAGSRSAWVAFGLVAVYAMVSAPGGMQRAAVASAAGTLGILGGAAAVDAFVRGGEARELATLTSRLPLWADLLGQAFPEEPLLGFGFQRIWYQEYFWSPGAYAASMAHNTFVQTLLGLGLAGLTVAGLQLGLTLAAAFRLRREPVGRSAWAILLPLLVNSWTEFGIFGPMNFATVLYQMVVILLALEDRPAWTGPAGTVREDAR